MLTATNSLKKITAIYIQVLVLMKIVSFRIMVPGGARLHYVQEECMTGDRRKIRRKNCKIRFFGATSILIDEIVEKTIFLRKSWKFFHLEKYFSGKIFFGRCSENVFTIFLRIVSAISGHASS